MRLVLKIMNTKQNLMAWDWRTRASNKRRRCHISHFWWVLWNDVVDRLQIFLTSWLWEIKDCPKIWKKSHDLFSRKKTFHFPIRARVKNKVSTSIIRKLNGRLPSNFTGIILINSRIRVQSLKKNSRFAFWVEKYLKKELRADRRADLWASFRSELLLCDPIRPPRVGCIQIQNNISAVEDYSTVRV